MGLAALVLAGAEGALPAAESSGAKPAAEKTAPACVVRLSSDKDSYKLDEDIVLDVRIENLSDNALTLTICDQMELCCIKSLHPSMESKVAACSMSFLDRCLAREPKHREAFLPRNAYYGYKVRISCSRLPEKLCAEGAEELKFSFVFEHPDGDTFRSNAVTLRVVK